MADTIKFSLEYASQEEAKTGTDNEKLMTPLRTAQAIAELSGLNLGEFTPTPNPEVLYPEGKKGEAYVVGDFEPTDFVITETEVSFAQGEAKDTGLDLTEEYLSTATIKFNGEFAVIGGVPQGDWVFYYQSWMSVYMLLSASITNNKVLELYTDNYMYPKNYIWDADGVGPATITFIEGILPEYKPKDLLLCIEDTTTINEPGKWVSYQKALTQDEQDHFTNLDNPHEVTAEQVGAAASSHNHSASEITSGELPIARGGTGATTAAAARTNLGASTIGHELFTIGSTASVRFLRINADTSVSQITPTDLRTAIDAAASSHNHSASEITSGTLSIARGGTGRTDGRSTGVIETRANVSTQFWTGTQAEYDNLTPDADTLYFIEE